ncbi:MAG: MATE family efflux transporter [Spirochaetales bacterium]|uniref:MATE family efflux transporter n=1 Tax=Bullifex sp. TaxID=2815808 RepID=UPI002A59754E|nr:MATE family efflux transporter [Bullifex sp.]MDD7271736.1 MATE family efflux transporter [Spirochaetales bacterium]MDY4066770.1 MATE family efflux transporter [Bullifex sp.]
MQIKLSDHFSYPRLFRFTLPSICMMLFTSVYLVIDGYFVSNFIGKTALAAVNMIYPVIMIIGSIGFMLGTGGSALVAKTMGEGDDEKAKRLFTLIYLTSIVVGLVLTIPSFIFLDKIAYFLGARDELLENSITYGRILLSTVVLFVVQMESQVFFITAEKPKLGLVMTVLSCGTNIILDALFCAILNLGVPGAAAATAVSQAIGGTIPLLYFTFKRKGRLYFTKTTFDKKALLKSASNGFSELLSNTSAAVIGMLFNAQLLRYVGENGVAAYSVLMYVSMVFVAIFIGFSGGISPVISYNYGSENHKELKSITHKLLTLIIITSLLMLFFSLYMASPLSRLFVGYDEELYKMTVRGFYIYSFSFIFAGISIFSSSFFTALNNGPVSAAISFLRTFVLQLIFVLVLPPILGIDGIWLSIVFAEIISFFISLYFLITKKKVYHY